MRAQNGCATAVLLLTALLASGAGAAPPQLRFGEGGTFKLIQLTDLHLGSSGVRDRRTTQASVGFKGEGRDAVRCALHASQEPPRHHRPHKPRLLHRPRRQC